MPNTYQWYPKTEKDMRAKLKALFDEYADKKKVSSSVELAYMRRRIKRLIKRLEKLYTLE